jgi:hypothetical protein
MNCSFAQGDLVRVKSVWCRGSAAGDELAHLHGVVVCHVVKWYSFGAASNHWCELLLGGESVSINCSMLMKVE